MISFGVYSQDIYVKAGSNHTSYHYTSADGEKSQILQAGLGNSYEIGRRFHFINRSRLGYEISLVLNEYNAIVGVPFASVKWNTGYAGFQTAIVCPVVELNFLTLDVRGGVGVSALLYGKQDLNGVVYDLRSNKDFNGALFQAFAGLQANLQASEDCHLSIGYNYSSTINDLKKPQKFSFEIHQVMFGIHLTVL